MNYLDVYFSRVNHMGETTGERIVNGGIRSFQRWKNESPHTVTTLSVERGIYFDGIILSNKDKDYQKIMILNVANDIPIRVGDIMNWQQDNGNLEKWLLIAEEHKVHPTYRSFNIIKCNYLIKWIDAKGYLRKSWAYVLSSIDSKIKGNFRTWHNGWKMVEADFTSVEGIMYMSLTENKVNLQYDDLNVDVADIDKLIFPTIQSVYTKGEEIVPEFNEQTLNEWQIVLVAPEVKEGEEPIVVPLDNGHLRAENTGRVIIKMRLKNYDVDDPRKAVTKEFEVTIIDSNVERQLYIKGPDSIRLDRYATYQLVDENIKPTEEEPEKNIIKESIVFELENITEQNIALGTLEKVYNQDKTENLYTASIHANNKNKLGEIRLSAEYNNQTYTKIIKIVPLW